jgi:hypothetical protein
MLNVDFGPLVDGVQAGGETALDAVKRVLEITADITSKAAEIMAVVVVDGSVFDAGEQGASTAFDRADGRVQKCTLGEAATTLVEPVGGEEGNQMVVYVTAEAGQTLAFGPSLGRPTGSQISNPITLEEGVYVVQMQYFLSQWNLVSFVGAYQTPS